MCDLTGCDASVSHFSFPIVILVHKTTTNIAATNISPITPFTPRRQQSLHSRHDATFHNCATTIFTTRHSTNTVRSRSPRDGWKERSGSSSNQCVKGHLPPRSPAQNARANISRPKRPREHFPLEFRSPLHRSEEREGGGVSSPDWRVRDVTWPKGRGGRPLFLALLEASRRGRG